MKLTFNIIGIIILVASIMFVFDYSYITELLNSFREDVAEAKINSASLRPVLKKYWLFPALSFLSIAFFIMSFFNDTWTETCLIVVAGGLLFGDSIHYLKSAIIISLLVKIIFF